MTLRITVTDIETGDSDEATVADGDYIVICADPCTLHHVESRGGGETHVLTITGREAS